MMSTYKKRQVRDSQGSWCYSWWLSSFLITHHPSLAIGGASPFFSESSFMVEDQQNSSQQVITYGVTTVIYSKKTEDTQLLLQPRPKVQLMDVCVEIVEDSDAFRGRVSAGCLCHFL